MNLTADLKPVQSPVNTRPTMIYSHEAVTRAAAGNMIASSDSTEHREQSIVTLLLLFLIVYGFLSDTAFTVEVTYCCVRYDHE
jgi:hypothetical protein